MIYVFTLTLLSVLSFILIPIDRVKIDMHNYDKAHAILVPPHIAFPVALPSAIEVRFRLD